MRSDRPDEGGDALRPGGDHVLGSGGGPVRARTDLTGGPTFWVSSRRVSRRGRSEMSGQGWSSVVRWSEEWAGLIKTGSAQSSMGPAWPSQPDSVQVARHIFRVLKIGVILISR